MIVLISFYIIMNYVVNVIRFYMILKYVLIIINDDRSLKNEKYFELKNPIIQGF